MTPAARMPHATNLTLSVGVSKRGQKTRRKVIQTTFSTTGVNAGNAKRCCEFSIAMHSATIQMKNM